MVIKKNLDIAVVLRRRNILTQIFGALLSLVNAEGTLLEDCFTRLRHRWQVRGLQPIKHDITPNNHASRITPFSLAIRWRIRKLVILVSFNMQSALFL